MTLPAADERGCLAAGWLEEKAWGPLGRAQLCKFAPGRASEKVSAGTHWTQKALPREGGTHLKMVLVFFFCIYYLGIFIWKQKNFYFAFPGGMEPLGVVSIPSLPHLHALGLGLACWWLSSAWTEHFGSALAVRNHPSTPASL